MLVAVRRVQDIGGSMLTPVGMSIVIHTFTDRRERARAIGVWSARPMAAFATVDSSFSSRSVPGRGRHHQQPRHHPPQAPAGSLATGPRNTTDTVFLRAVPAWGPTPVASPCRPAACPGRRAGRRRARRAPPGSGRRLPPAPDLRRLRRPPQPRPHRTAARHPRRPYTRHHPRPPDTAGHPRPGRLRTDPRGLYHSRDLLTTAAPSGSGATDAYFCGSRFVVRGRAPGCGAPRRNRRSSRRRWPDGAPTDVPAPRWRRRTLPRAPLDDATSDCARWWHRLRGETTTGLADRIPMCRTCALCRNSKSNCTLQ